MPSLFEDEYERAANTGSSENDGGGENDLPAAICVAACAVLPIAGASISVALGSQRFPLGSSSPVAALAESLQFTVGDGPCLEAIRTASMIDAPTARFSTRWAPLFDLYRQQTPYRSVASLPLRLGSTVHGAMNLFFDHERGGQDLNLLQTQTVSTESAALLARWTNDHQHDLQTAIETAGATPRNQMWIAVGMLMEAGHLNGIDALALLRAHAYRDDTTIDDLAQQLINGTATLQALLD